MRTLTTLALMLAVGCSAATDDKDVVEPEFGKSDSLRSVQTKSALHYDEPIDGVFDEDATFHGYTFGALATGKVTVEVTQAGSSRGLDTTMFLFGQKSHNDWERIAFDDDDGWGKLSRLRDIRVEDYGRYMVVIGTSDGMGRGNYRLSLECTNGECLDTTPVDLDDCGGALYDAVDTCIADALDNWDFGWDDPAEEMAIEYCTDDGLEELRDWSCPVDDPAAPDYCRASPAELRAAGGLCETTFKDEYRIVDTVALGRHTMPDALQELADALWDSGDFVRTELHSYTVAESAEAMEVAQSVANDYVGDSDHATRRDFSVGAEQTRSEYRDGGFARLDIVDAIEAEHGTDYIVGTASGSYYVAAGAEEWVGIDVIYYRNLGIAYTITEVSGED